MKETYLHIGPPKTASTYLQKGVWNNRDDLRRRGLLYPADHDHEFILAANEVQEGRFLPVGDNKGTWNKVVDRARSWPGTVLISTELFAFCEPDQIQRVAESLGPATLELIVMARCRADMLPSLYQERVKMVTAEDSWEGFLADFCDSHESWPLAPGVLVERWLPYVGAQHMHVVTVPKRMADPHLLLDRFADVLRIDSADLGAGEQKLNPSLDAIDVALLRAVTARTADSLDHQAQKELIAGRLVPLLRELDRPQRPLRLPASLRPLMTKIGADDVAALTASGCHVHGDLDDLLPDDRAFDNSQAAGGQMPETDVLAAAIDVLVVAAGRATSSAA